MKKSLLQQLLLYRYRYAVAYVLFFVLLVSLLTMQITSTPQGLSAAERESAVQSASIAFKADTDIVNLPYYLAQKVSIKLLGLTELAIKLPSLLFGLLSGVGIVLLLRRWFSRNVAMIAALFIVTNVLFLVAARTGTPAIMLIFYSTYILLFSTLITQQARGQWVWRVGLGALVAVALYTPLSVYVLASCLIAGLLHPHSRYILKHFNGRQFVGAMFFFVPLIAPLAYAVWRDYQVIIRLLGFAGELPGAAAFASSLMDVALRLGGITEPYVGEFVQPAFSIVSLALIGLGLLRTFIDFHATRTYALLIWLAIITPAVILNPAYLPIIFVPSALLIAIGLQTLIREWYALFPRNPYARLFGLMPLLVLIGGVIFFNYTSYFYGMRYSPDTSRVYSNDLRLLNDTLKRTDLNREQIIVAAPQADLAFYKLLTRPGLPLAVVDASGFSVGATKGTYIVTAKEVAAEGTEPATWLSVNDRRYDSLRWRTYVKW